MGSNIVNWAQSLLNIYFSRVSESLLLNSLTIKQIREIWADKFSALAWERELTGKLLYQTTNSEALAMHLMGYTKLDELYQKYQEKAKEIAPNIPSDDPNGQAMLIRSTATTFLCEQYRYYLDGITNNFGLGQVNQLLENSSKIQILPGEVPEREREREREREKKQSRTTRW